MYIDLYAQKVIFRLSSNNRYILKNVNNILKHKKSARKVLINCVKDNTASASVARKNGGVLADEITEEDGNIMQRYWITLT